MEWFVAVGGERLGPVPLAELLTLARAGKIKASDLVWREGMPQWTPAGEAAELAAILTRTSPPPQAPLGEDPVMRALLPVGRSGWAIAAGYLGLFSLLAVPGPLAVICAVLAIREIRRNPLKHGMGRAIFGLVMGAFGTACLVLIVAGVLK